MKKLILRSLVMFAVVLASCSDDEPKKKIETPLTSETPFNAYMQTVAAGSVGEYTDGTIYSVGYQFKTKKVGTITELGVAAPQAGTYLVTLYDATTSVPLGSAEVTLTEAQITANPYGFQYAALTIPVQVEVDQVFNIVYDMNSGAESIYRPLVDLEVFQMEGSFIEFQGGIFGYPGDAPSSFAGNTYYTADIKITY